MSTTPKPEEKLLELLRRRGGSLYALLDAARDTMVPALLFNSQECYQSLYEGAEGAELALVAPYLVRLPPESPLLQKVVEQGWGKNWGIFLVSERPFEELRHHFRHFLMVKLPSDEQVYFRFYDPRVLRVFLPTCTPEEINQFFGPIRFFLMEDEKPDKLLVFANTGLGAEHIQVPLVATGSGGGGSPSAVPSP